MAAVEQIVPGLVAGEDMSWRTFPFPADLFLAHTLTPSLEDLIRKDPAVRTVRAYSQRVNVQAKDQNYWTASDRLERFVVDRIQYIANLLSTDS